MKTNSDSGKSGGGIISITNQVSPPKDPKFRLKIAKNEDGRGVGDIFRLYLVRIEHIPRKKKASGIKHLIENVG